MGIMSGTGLADTISKAFVFVSSAHTLPFWALPVVAMAGIGIQRVMGYTVVTFVVTGVIYGLALLLLA